MRTLALLTALCFAACAHTPTPAPSATTCADVCARGAELACTWATPTPKGATCIQVCENAALHVPWELDCLVLSESCADADVCGRR